MDSFPKKGCFSPFSQYFSVYSMPRWMSGGRRCVVWPGTSVYQPWMNVKTFLLKFHSTGVSQSPKFY